jgi:streptogramin lyase
MGCVSPRGNFPPSCEIDAPAQRLTALDFGFFGQRRGRPVFRIRMIEIEGPIRGRGDGGSTGGGTGNGGSGGGAGGTTIDQFAVPTQNSMAPFGPQQPFSGSMLRASDNAVWFPEPNADKLGRVDAAGRVTELPLARPADVPAGDGYWFPEALIEGPDHALWFRANFGIGRTAMTAGGNDARLYELPPDAGVVQQLVSGPDGAIWFGLAADDGTGTGTVHGRVGRLSIADAGYEFFDLPRPPTGASYPASLAFGPDGNLWFTDPEQHRIGRMTTGGATTFFGPTRGEPSDIVVGPDAALWLTEAGFSDSFGESTDQVARITATGELTEYASAPGGSGTEGPSGIAAGPDGALWVTGAADHTLLRITPTGRITRTAISQPNGNDQPTAAVAGPGGIWFTEVPPAQAVFGGEAPTTDHIGRLRLP